MQVWLRAPVIDLARDFANVIQEARKRGFSARSFRFYCDTLVVAQATTISAPAKDDGKPGYFDMQIFARRIDAQGPLIVNLATDCALSIMTPNVKGMLQIQFQLPSGVSSLVDPVVPDTHFGVEYSLSDSGRELQTQYRRAPQAGLELLNYLNLINEDGTLQNRDYVNE